MNSLNFKTKSKNNSNELDLSNQKYKQAICAILTLNKREHLDYPYIITYRREVFYNILTEDQVWKIQDLNSDWELFNEKRKKVLDSLNTFSKSALNEFYNFHHS